MVDTVLVSVPEEALSGFMFVWMVSLGIWHMSPWLNLCLWDYPQEVICSSRHGLFCSWYVQHHMDMSARLKTWISSHAFMLKCFVNGRKLSVVIILHVCHCNMSSFDALLIEKSGSVQLNGFKGTICSIWTWKFPNDSVAYFWSRIPDMHQKCVWSVFWFVYLYIYELSHE